MKEIWESKTNEELCIEYQKTKNEDLFEYFLSRNYGLIMSYITPIITKHPEYKEDLTHLCEIGMWEAMNTFIPTKEAKFTTYVYYFFKKYAWRNLHSQFLVHIPINLIRDLSEVKQKYPDSIIKLESLDEKLNLEDSNSQTVLDTIKSKDLTPEEIVLRDDGVETIRKIARENLLPREYRCVELYYGLDGGGRRTLQQIGNEFNVTRERIRQIIAKALRKLKKYLIMEEYDV